MRAEQSPDDPEEHKSRSCLPFRLPPRHPPSNKKKENPLLEKPAYQPYNSASKTKKRPSRIPSTSNQRSPVSLTPSRNSSIRSSDTTPRHSRNSSSSSNPLESLLVPPTPIDRSPQTLHRLSSSGKKQQRRGLYDGEIEPEGVRGQEAVVVSPDQEPSIPIPVRNFRAASPSLPAVQERAPLQFSPETGKAVRFQPEGVASDPSRLMPRFTRNHSDAESTNSDDDIEYMMADFLPSDTSGGISPQPSQQQRSTSALERGSPLQIVAAVPSSSNSSASSGNHTHQQNTSLEQLNAAALEHVHRAEYDSALQIFTRVLQIYKTQNHPKSLQASAYHNLGTVHAKRAAMLPEDSPAQRHCRATALEHFQAAARHARDSLGANHPNVAVSLVRIGFLLLQSRQYPHAVVTFQEALRIRLAAFGREHGLVANLYNNLGVCHMHLQEFAQGRDQLELALQIQRDLVENEDGHQKNMSTSTDPWVHQLELADTLFNLGGLHLEWIRKQGPDVRRRKDAIAAFTETWQVRCF